MQPVNVHIRKRVFIIRKKKLRQTHVSAFRWKNKPVLKFLLAIFYILLKLLVISYMIRSRLLTIFSELFGDLKDENFEVNR